VGSGTRPVQTKLLRKKKFLQLIAGKVVPKLTNPQTLRAKKRTKTKVSYVLKLSDYEYYTPGLLVLFTNIHIERCCSSTGQGSKP
jgi:hypothetical protein